MSGFNKLREKAAKGQEWRGDITVGSGDDALDLKIRQLNDPEYYEVMSGINHDELEELGDMMPEDDLERFRELDDMDDRTEEQEAEMQLLEEDLNRQSAQIFKIMSKETFEAIRTAAKYGVVPSEDDVREMMMDDSWVKDKEDMGYDVSHYDGAYEALNDETPMIIDGQTDLESFEIGMEVIYETVGGEGN